MWRNSNESYGWASIILHWATLPLVVFLLVSGIYMVTLTYYDSLYHTLPQWHKVVGVMVALFTFLRLGLMPVNRHPAMLPMPAWQQFAARVAHYLMYIFLLVLIGSGYCITTAEGHPIVLGNVAIGKAVIMGEVQIPALTTFEPGTVTLLGLVHQWTGYALGALICVHAGAALHHHFILRDNTLRRMLFPQRSTRS